MITNGVRAGRKRLAAAALATALVAPLGGCGVFDESEERPAAPERAKLKVSVIPTIDVAPIHLGIKTGAFKDVGLDVEVVKASSGQDGLAKLKSGEVDIAYGGYVPFFLAQSTGDADLKFVSDAASADRNTLVVATTPTSDVKKVKDLPGKRIAINGVNGVSDTLTKSVMKNHGLDYNDVDWVTLKFPEMAGALVNGEVDAAFLTEPFITEASKSAGIIPIADAADGPTRDLPIGGYAALNKLTEENPNTVAAFQRAMNKAAVQAEDRSALEPVLVETSNVDADTAALTSLPRLGSTLDKTRLQRVSDLLTEFGIIGQPVDAGSMLVNPTKN